jgi:hypothetical protein
MKAKLELFAPENYWKASEEERDKIAGGCGPGGFGDYLVPDTVWLLNIKPACKIHDWMYHFGENLADKEEADRVFLNNMTRMVNTKTKWGWMRKLRLRRVYTYYQFVDKFGGPSFWDSKNKETEFQNVA